jgi:hypothetical protein
MTGICIEAGMTCPSCESSVPLNALVSNIKCPGCGEDIKLSLDNWKSILEEAVKRSPSCDEGEGSSLSIFSEYKFGVLYGKLAPRYNDTKDTIQEDLLLAAIDKGVVKHPVTNAPTSIRRIPTPYAEEFKGVIALVGEDASLLPGNKAGQPIEEGTSRPVAFQCPCCSGSLIIDGKERTVVCSFCDTQVYLPDDLWRTLHPVKKKRRWFLLFDEMQRPIEWTREVYSAVQDDRGNFYFALETDYGESTLLVSTGPDRLLRWKRDDLDINPVTTRGYAKIALTGDNRLLAACADRPKLFIVSTEDGTTIDVVDEPEDKGDDRSTYFSMLDTFDFGVFPDTTLLLYRICNRKDEYGPFYELQRFDLKGNLLELWDPASERLSLFEKIRKFFSSRILPYSITDMKDFPVGARETDIRITIGTDGSVYLLSFTRLAKLKPSGRILYSIELPCHYTTGRVALNDKGEAFVVSHREDDRIEILRISPDGTEITAAVKSRVDGGPLEDAGQLTLSPDGVFNLIGYDGYWGEFAAAR